MSYLTIKIGAWAICALASLTLLWDASKAPQSFSMVSAATTYATIPPTPLSQPSTPPTTTPATACAGALNTALEIGWPSSETPILMRVLKRESRCDQYAFNPYDSNGGSYGLMQINGFWCTPSIYWPKGWLQAQGILTECNQLFDPKVNLTAALAIWHNSSWTPWNLPK